MTKILVNDEWYESIDPGTYYETEFEIILMQKSSVLFPGFYSLPFKKIVTSEFDSARADYALIDKKYREWWIVEVELSHHSLYGHVIPQVQTLVNANYGREEAEYLLKLLADLDRKSLMDMMKGMTPKVLVVVDRPKHDWISELDRYDAKLAVFEILKSRKNRYIHRINGFLPSLTSEMMSRCRPDPHIPMLLQVDTPAVLNVQPNELVEIIFDGRITLWSRMDSSDRVWLKPERRNPLDSRKEYKISRTGDGNLHFEEYTSKK
jgi:hypothetical protein